MHQHTSQDRSTTALLASNNRDANRGYNNRGTNRGRYYNSGRGNGRNTNRTTFNRKNNSHGTLLAYAESRFSWSSFTLGEESCSFFCSLCSLEKGFCEQGRRHVFSSSG